ncbi:MAG: HAMP domain-containing sensor histidine kinase [Alcanivoracaceae bacterium]|jgi:signal transduction histidine kinase|nr:HAMP domain-containing sensor histidine kinase [Alcanivoracaceae bacterium]
MSPRRRSGVQHRLARAYLLQVIMISLATVLSVVGSAKIIETVLVKQALVMEADHFWSLQREKPDHPRPNTRHLLGLLERPAGGDAIPSALEKLDDGYTRVNLNGSEPLVYVESREDKRLFLIFDEQRVGWLALVFGVLPLIAVLLVIYFTSFLTWRRSRQLVSPLVQLAELLRRTPVKDPKAARPDFSMVEAEADSEVAVLVVALEAYSERLVGFVERERQFTRDASHELRTPLAVIRANMELLSAKHGTSPAMRRIEDTLDDMESLIETLLLLARSEGTSLPDEELIINDMALNLLERIMPLAERKSVDVRLQQRAMLSVHAPETVLNIVLTNLVRNAINYTGSGQVTVEVDTRSVTVCDTGPGISAEDLARLMQPFERGSRVGEAGTGLGLAIVQRLCERYRWQLEFASVKGQGTQVRVVFPMWQRRSATLR